MLAVMADLTNRRVDLSVLKDRLKKRREALRLDQEALAERAGMSPAYISRLERGAIPNPKVFDLEQVAAALGSSIGELMLVDGNVREIHVSTCADILGQLADEPPEVTDTILRWLRESVSLAKQYSRQN